MPWQSVTTKNSAILQSVLCALGERVGACLLAGWLTLAAASAAAVAAP